jgi:hypothetical protein
MARQHYTFRIIVTSTDAFVVSADGPGLISKDINMTFFMGEVKAVASLSKQLSIRSRARNQLATYTAREGTCKPCADPRKCSGVDFTVQGLFHSAHVRKPQQYVPTSLMFSCKVFAHKYCYPWTKMFRMRC